MSIELSTPRSAELAEAVAALREWQHEGAGMQLHPGDLGWFWRFGVEATTAALRTWHRDGCILGIGLLDGPTLFRLTLAPEAGRDEELAEAMTADLTNSERGVLIEREVSVEAPPGALIRDLLAGLGWTDGESMTPLSRDLTRPVQDPGMRIEVVGAEQARVRTALQRSAFDRSTFTDAHWHAMARGLPYQDARCLVAHDDNGTAVAAVTVWSAGPGKPGLLEPMGVDREHRRRGYGKAITLAAAKALQELGSSSALVCTQSCLVGAVATYRSAGFSQLGESRDKSRNV